MIKFLNWRLWAVFGTFQVEADFFMLFNQENPHQLKRQILAIITHEILENLGWT